jgi:4-hydroxybenzoate polyprenyltransferase
VTQNKNMITEQEKSDTSVSYGKLLRRPLYVDMDGTLLATDALWELLILLLKVRPVLLLRAPFWLMKGRAFFKHELASHIALNPALLPYHDSVISFLTREQKQGRRIILATASDRLVAESVAHQVGLFSAVLASDGSINLKGRAKLLAILKDADGLAFDYIGNSSVDVPVWQHASLALLVQPSRRLLAKAVQASANVEILCPRVSFVRALVRTLRVHQWTKNLLVFAPLMLAHRMTDRSSVVASVITFMSFCLCASSAYVLNDLMDVHADRQHPKKKNRPFAAGVLSIQAGLFLFAFVLSGGLILAGYFVSPLVSAGLVLYCVATTTYTLYLKRLEVVDVLILAGLYTLRVLVGAQAANVPLSPWFLAYSMFLFLSLAIIKRYAELSSLNARFEGTSHGRGYMVKDMDLLRAVGVTTGYMSVLVMALYLNSKEVTALYRHYELLWLVCPLLLYWVTRVWFITERGNMHEDPVVFALKDRTSYAIGLIILMLMFFAV